MGIQTEDKDFYLHEFSKVFNSHNNKKTSTITFKRGVKSFNKDKKKNKIEEIVKARQEKEKDEQQYNILSRFKNVTRTIDK